MADLWYFAHDGARMGPFSPRQLKDLADSGTILSSDTVWKEGIDQGVLASRVRNLFPFIPADIAPAIASDLPVVAAAEIAPSTPPPQAAATPVEPRAQPEPTKRGRASALKGAEIVSQDGTQAKYRKKCVECGHKDSSTQTIVLSNKTVKANFFCPKCRKRREVAIQCFSK